MRLSIPSEVYRKLSLSLYYTIIGLFCVAVALNLIYQASYVLNLNSHMPFLEADNYEYYLFANLSIATPTFTPSTITNPYLIGAPPGFFEHPGLYLMPVYLYKLIHLPLVWDFRILQSIAVFTIYVMSFLLVRKILKPIPLHKIYYWLAYTVVLTSFLLMQYNEITEWRGNEFVVAISLLIVYLFGWINTKRKRYATIVGWILITACTLLGIWIWSAGGIVLVLLVTALFAAVIVYPLLRHPRVLRYVALGAVICAVIIFFFSTPIESWLSSFTAHYGFSGCQINPLHIGELECLNPSNGLIAVLMMLIFGMFALVAFLGDTIMSNKRSEYEYYLFGVFVAGILFLPLAMIYIRMLDLVAPYFTIMYACGIVAMLSYFSKSGSNKIVLSLTILLILLSSFVGQYLFYISSTVLYQFANPPGLYNATVFMKNQAPNATVLSYYAYSDYLEAYGHLHTYTDTIQGLNYTKIEKIDSLFEQNSSTFCAGIQAISPIPHFILVSSGMLNSTIFEHAPASSIIRNPESFNNSCGYTLDYIRSGFYVFSRRGR